MKTLLFAAFAMCVLMLSACEWFTVETGSESGSDMQVEDMMIEGNDPSNDGDDMMEDASSSDATMSDASMSSADTSADEASSARYSAYDDAVLANGETKVLFFHAAWCPVCRAAEEEITAWYGAGRPSLNMYKVDYDTETELKSRFGVTYQHTFVLVDGEGNAVTTVQGPSDDQLLRMIGA